MVRNSKIMGEIIELETPAPVTALNFVSVAERKEIEVTDGIGNSILVSSKGSSDCVEYSKVIGLSQKAQSSPQAAATFEIDLVVLCLRYRHKLAQTVPDENVLLDKDGEPLAISLVKKLFEFFIKELGLQEAFKVQQELSVASRPLQFEDATPYLDK
ncbi:hypothetical protein QT972_00190 [Microcoleus sp. herbarium7]|uniref:hypothetical protein n=1 Tax=Microcoleus sp. herbarium7 TaxID=3055435 RepID=UPI002FD40E05